MNSTSKSPRTRAVNARLGGNRLTRLAETSRKAQALDTRSSLRYVAF